MAYFIPIVLITVITFVLSDAQECNYSNLAKSVISNEKNMYELSRAFFPPDANAPEFVTVKYMVDDKKNQTWYWSTFTSSFIHPPEVIQFMSLFFAKPHNYYKGEVPVTLTDKVVECVNDPLKMQLLTQRVSYKCVFYRLII